MNKFYQFQGFQKVSCQKVQHEDKYVNSICFEKECQQQRLLCSRCYNSHKQHKLIEIQQVQNSFQEIKNSINSNSLLRKIEKILYDFETLSSIKLKELVRDLNQLIEFQNLMESSFLNNRITSYSELQSQIHQFFAYFEFRDGTKIQLKNIQPSDLFPILEERINKFQQEIANFWKYNLEFIDEETPTQRDSYVRQNQQPEQYLQDYQEPYQQPQEIIKIPLQLQLESFQFSEQFCSKQIKCMSPKCVKKTGVNNANDVACLNYPLSPYEKKSFVFRINKITGYIGIGIAILQVIQPQNFFFGQLNQTGHGVFMVLNNRVVYNNSYSQYNRISVPIELKQGNMYQLTFDPLNRNRKQFNLKPLNDYKADPFGMPMVIDETLDYHAFVHIGINDGEIELLNEF